MLTRLRVGPRPVALIRALIGFSSLGLVREAVGILHRLQAGHIHAPLIAWLPAPDFIPGALIAVGLLAAGVGLILGILPWLCAAAIALTHFGLMVLDLQFYSNHRWLLVLLCVWLVFAKSDRAYSLWRWPRRTPDPDGDQVPWWPQLLIMVTVFTVYLFGALSKINPSWLAGNVIRNDVDGWVPAVPVAWGTIPVELFIGFALWFPRTRLIAVFIGVILHASFMVFMNASSLTFFALLMWAGYVAFLTRPSFSWSRAKPVEDGSPTRDHVSAAP